jgi:DNA-3-methyladenine glycosylase
MVDRSSPKKPSPLEPLPREFYQRDAHDLTKALLGKLLARRWRGELLVGRIVETESYVGEDDLACHASKGRTARTEVMFGEPGRAYVYLIYGMYEMLNVVANPPGSPAAILIRALEPLAGIPAMERARKTDKLANLTTGPGKLTQAFHVTRALNGEDLTRDRRLFIADDGFAVDPARDIETTPRVGIDYAGHCVDYPWRYYLRHNRFVSRK